MTGNARRMRVLALVEQPNHVCYRYRIAAFAPALAAAGIDLEAEPIARGLVARLAQIRRVRDADAVILQRKLLPIWQLAWLRRHCRRLAYDFDDALYLRDSNSHKPHASNMRLMRFWATVQAAELVIGGNQVLVDRAEAYTIPGRTCQVPTCVDVARYPVATHVRQGTHVLLAWIGQAGTLSGLARAQPVIETLCRSKLQLNVVCDRAPDLPQLITRLVPWSEATEAANLANADIGISWLPPDAWSEGKCGLKVLQYMAAGLPVVANRVGPHRDIIVDGETGYLADTHAQWQSAIDRLANDASLRARLGAHGRRRVESLYSTEVWGPRFAQIVRGFMGRTCDQNFLGPVIPRTHLAKQVSTHAAERAA